MFDRQSRSAILGVRECPKAQSDQDGPMRAVTMLKIALTGGKPMSDIREARKVLVTRILEGGGRHRRSQLTSASPHVPMTSAARYPGWGSQARLAWVHALYRAQFAAMSAVRVCRSVPRSDRRVASTYRACPLRVASDRTRSRKLRRAVGSRACGPGRGQAPSRALT